ncbi:MAG: histidine kinase N-terminal domain-containing protein, partial [Actinobacteria bacterium]|nr:histidine kinase N-terminal domain-containing protein [Actinomycetota bacterium]
RSLRTGEIVENDTPAIGSKERVRVQCIPVRCDDTVVALVTRDLSMTASRRPGEPERGELDAPHGHPRVRERAAAARGRLRRRGPARCDLRVPAGDGGARTRRRLGVVARAAAARVGAADRRHHDDPRRHRPQASRPDAALEGRDDPRDPPPGEEQPADHRGVAAPAGSASGVAGGPGGARGVGTPDPVDRNRARDALA